MADTRLEIAGRPELSLQLVTAADSAGIEGLYTKNADYLARYNYGWSDRTPKVIKAKVTRNLQAVESGRSVEYLILQEHDHDAEIVGTVGFYNIDPNGPQAAMSYFVAEKFSGQGIAKAAAQRLAEYGVSKMGLKKIVGEIDPNNTASRKIAEALGSHPVGEVYYVEEAGKRFPNQRWEVDFD